MEKYNWKGFQGEEVSLDFNNGYKISLEDASNFYDEGLLLVIIKTEESDTF